MHTTEGILVTGALGNVGREVTRALLELPSPPQLRVADLDLGELRATYPGASATRLDFLDRSTWTPALEGSSQVFLMRPPPLGDMDATLCPFVDAAFGAGVRHVVFLSVAGADRMKWVPHRKVELHLEQNAGANSPEGPSFTVLRPGFFMQNLKDAYRRDLIEEGRLYVPAGSGKVAFVDARDLGDAAARVCAAPEKHRASFLTLTGGEALTFFEVATELTRVLGRPIRYEPASLVGYAHHLRARRGLSWMQVVVQSILHFGLRRGDAEAIDPTLAELLGRPPRTLRTYVEENAATWR
jgi:uncharacterized protein YbjT (DUF2867 family)